MDRWTRRSFLAAGLALGACTRLERPPLRRLYRMTGGAGDQPPLVIIPGAFGSRLRNRRTGQEIWPGSPASLLTSSYRGLELEIDAAALEPRADDAEAHDLFEAGLGVDFYGQVLHTLEWAGGYSRCGAGAKPCADRRNFYVYPYDFRLDLVRAVRGLHELIENIRRDYGDPRQPVDVLAHSIGGLLARYYARYGAAELPESGTPRPSGAGLAAIRRLLLVGTPNLGTLQPVLACVRGEEVGLRHIPPEVIATCNGTPQMMPHPAVRWLLDRRGVPLDLDLFDIGTWRELGWGVFDPLIAARTVARHGGGAHGRRYLALLQDYVAKHLRRGRRFIEALSAPAPGTRPPLRVFGGDCELTLARLVAEEGGTGTAARERVEDIVAPLPGVDYERLMFEPGDTVVTRSSLLGRVTLDVGSPRTGVEALDVTHTVFLCERHQQLTGNPSFQDNLLHALLSVDPV